MLHGVHSAPIMLPWKLIQYSSVYPCYWPVTQTATLQINNKQTQAKSRHEQDTTNKCYIYNDKTGKGKDVPVKALKAYEELEA